MVAGISVREAPKVDNLCLGLAGDPRIEDSAFGGPQHGRGSMSRVSVATKYSLYPSERIVLFHSCLRVP